MAVLPPTEAEIDAAMIRSPAFAKVSEVGRAYVKKAIKEGLDKLTVPELTVLARSLPNIKISGSRTKVPLLEAVYPVLSQALADLQLGADRRPLVLTMKQDNKAYQSLGALPGRRETFGDCIDRNRFHIPPDLNDLGLLGTECLWAMTRDCNFTPPPNKSRSKKGEFLTALAPQLAQVYNEPVPQMPIDEKNTNLVKRWGCQTPAGEEQRPRPEGGQQPVLAALPARQSAVAALPARQPPVAALPARQPFPARQPASPARGAAPIGAAAPPGAARAGSSPAAPARQGGLAPPPPAGGPAATTFFPLSYQYAEQGIYPPQISQRGRPSVRSLEKLPDSEIRRTLLFLPYRELIETCKASRKMAWFCNDDELWAARLRREFPYIKSTNRVTSKELYQYIQYMIEQRAKVHIIPKNQLSYGYQEEYRDILLREGWWDEVINDPAQRETLQNQYSTNLHGLVNERLVGQIEDLRRGDIIQLESAPPGDEFKFIYNGQTFERLTPEGAVPASFPVIDEFPIIYWSEAVQNPTVHFNAKPYIGQIMKNLSLLPVRTQVRFVDLNGIWFYIHIPNGDSAGDQQIRDALGRGQFSHRLNESNGDPRSVWNSLVLQV